MRKKVRDDVSVPFSFFQSNVFLAVFELPIFPNNFLLQAYSIFSPFFNEAHHLVPCRFNPFFPLPSLSLLHVRMKSHDVGGMHVHESHHSDDDA